MSFMVTAELKNGIIYGDFNTSEYVYMPASELGLEKPFCVFETPGERRDITLPEAVTLVRRLSLKPVRHPLLGYTSC